MKEQGKNAPDLTNEEEIGSLPEKESRIMIVKMIQNLRNRIDKMQKNISQGCRRTKEEPNNDDKHNKRN